ncbi:hypothetical protein [Yoonia sp. 208BN28-4]|uniref:hypothetical protein n=1 Tax=Yoonia sp. 208BN28-4 TaxID=3126505 RepID=UPI0030B71170
MRSALILLPLILTACATPREACLNRVNSELRVLDRLITETRGNLSRGYAIEERQEVRVRNRTCESVNSRGIVTEFDCSETDTITRREPVAIDLNAERAKLESLEQRQAQNRVNAQNARAQCVAANPE